MRSYMRSSNDKIRKKWGQRARVKNAKPRKNETALIWDNGSQNMNKFFIRW